MMSFVGTAYNRGHLIATVRRGAQLHKRQGQVQKYTALRKFQIAATMPQRSENELVNDVLTHWFGSPDVDRYSKLEEKYSLWYGATKEIDEDIRNKFGEDVELALNGGWDKLIGSETNPVKAELTLCIMLDQYTRNIYRGKAKAFAGDAKCLEVVNTILVPEKWQMARRILSPVQCSSFLLPLMHQESLEELDRCSEKAQELISDCQSAAEEGEAIAKSLEELIKYAKRHRDIIERFNRYPHRNQALGRVSTEEELEYLKDAPRFGQ